MSDKFELPSTDELERAIFYDLGGNFPVGNEYTKYCDLAYKCLALGRAIRALYPDATAESVIEAMGNIADLKFGFSTVMNENIRLKQQLGALTKHPVIAPIIRAVLDKILDEANTRLDEIAAAKGGK